ncbi:MFS transporter [Ammoniphilus sp. YIM 78166]|uniref:MFS transporter n=1 Tax=Ammoniphilus sp. YIM 78166 TaxID=1644106 RepID=UPI002104A69D|nr:MFS transporter [Ammoniphilus sp. YIM 78166]
MNSALQDVKRHNLFFIMFYFLTFYGIGSLFPLLTVYLKDVAGLSGTEVGIIMSISPVVTLFAQPVWGMVSDYTQKPRVILTVSLVLSSILGLVYSSGTGYWYIFIAAAALAISQSAIVPVSDSIALNFVQKVKGDYGGLRLWGAVGFAVSVLIGGRIAEMFGLNVIFYLFSGIMLATAIVAWSLPNESQSMKVDLSNGLSLLFGMKRYVIFLLITFCIFGPIYANNFYFGLLITELGGTLTGVGFAFLLAAGSEAPFMKIASRWIARIGMMKILIMAAAIAGLRWFIYFFEPPLAIVYLSTIAQGFSVGMFIPAALQYVRDLAPADVRVTAVSLYSAFGNGLGTLFCTFLSGMIFEYFSIGFVYLFYGALTMVGVLLLVVLQGMEGKFYG